MQLAACWQKSKLLPLQMHWTVPYLSLASRIPSLKGEGAKQSSVCGLGTGLGHAWPRPCKRHGAVPLQRCAWPVPHSGKGCGHPPPHLPKALRDTWGTGTATMRPRIQILLRLLSHVVLCRSRRRMLGFLLSSVGTSSGAWHRLRSCWHSVMARHDHRSLGTERASQFLNSALDLDGRGHASEQPAPLRLGLPGAQDFNPQTTNSRCLMYITRCTGLNLRASGLTVARERHLADGTVLGALGVQGAPHRTLGLRIAPVSVASIGAIPRPGAGGAGGSVVHGAHLCGRGHARLIRVVHWAAGNSVVVGHIQRGRHDLRHGGLVHQRGCNAVCGPRFEDELAGLLELHSALAEVVQRTLYHQQILFEVHQEVVPELLLGEHFGIPDEHQTTAGPCKCHIQPPRIIEKPNALMIIGPDKGKNDELLLTALERIHRRHFNLLVQLRAEGPVALHVIDNIRPLAFIRGDHPKSIRCGPGFQEVRHNLLHHCCLSAIQIRRP
mmetsp:Transcript_81322/g.136075  ORF Transcript_81322/g.136075 Transcript_81322/m.136075 type:complete len:496 (-) Transcript_81322:2259-3746(-)